MSEQTPREPTTLMACRNCTGDAQCSAFVHIEGCYSGGPYRPGGGGVPEANVPAPRARAAVIQYIGDVSNHNPFPEAEDIYEGLVELGLLFTPDPLAGVQVGDPDPTASDEECGHKWPNRGGGLWGCTRALDHEGQHIAGDTEVVCAVLPRASDAVSTLDTSTGEVQP